MCTSTSSAWHFRFLRSSLVLSSYLFLITNILIQGFALYMIAEDERTLSRYAGEMHLCDFGATAAGMSCPDSPNCVGPGGTQITPQRVYDFNSWSTRTFVRESLLQIFPDRADDIYARETTNAVAADLVGDQLAIFTSRTKKFPPPSADFRNSLSQRPPLEIPY